MDRAADPQGDLFPRCSPETVLLHLARAARRVRAAQLTADHCHALLGEVALLELRLDRITHQQQLADVFARHWRTPVPHVVYRPVTTPALVER